MNRKVIPDLALGLGLGLFALAEALRAAAPYRDAPSVDFGDPKDYWTILIDALIVGWGMAAAAGLHRRAPGAALLLAWLAGGFQLIFGVDILLTELAVTVVAFGCARWGSTAVVWISGLSIPVGALAAMVFIRSHGFPVGETVGTLIYELRLRLWPTGATAVTGWLLVAVVGACLLVVPWLVGLLLRARATAGEREVARQIAVREAEQAQEIAHLREQQANLARDVHDVVGHSLAVILAQAESAQFRKETDTEALKQSMRDIATSARGSLQDVRQVLSGGADATTQATGGLDSLIDGVRASGHEVLAEVTGTPQPLPPELDVVAYRVLQEMLTNAIKHGRRGSPLTVSRRWGDGLVIEVSNSTDDPSHEAGQGLIGMQRRLDGVAGRLDVRRERDVFVATARIPVRPA
jgi:signal transduction histidine kinase